MDLSCCKFSPFIPRPYEAISCIVANCPALIEVNLKNTRLCKTSIDILCEGLTTNVEKLSLYGLWYVEDCHVTKLLARCTKLTELDLRYTSISVTSVNTIIECASQNLVKLGIDTYSFVKFSKLLELSKMPRLKVLWFEGPESSGHEKEKMQKNLSYLSINQEVLQIAGSNQYFKPEEGFWDIHAISWNIFQRRRF